jgi:hypothetical protein
MKRCTPLAAILVVVLQLAWPPLPAGAEDPEPAAPEPIEANACGADLQACTTAVGDAWCCPVQASGAYLCCGAVAGVCHACDVEALPDEVQSPVEVPIPSELPRAE